MPRFARILLKKEKAVYHVMSRTALPGFPFDSEDKDMFLRIIKHLSRVYFCEIMGYCIMGNHFHILITMLSGDNYTETDIMDRYHRYYGEKRVFDQENSEHYRNKWESLSEFVREVKQTFSRYYNKKNNRRGTLWGERFKSVLVERGETLVHCLAYIDMNPVRAGLADKPEDYRWSSIGYHMQTGNRNGFLSLDFGLREFGLREKAKCLGHYRAYLYKYGANPNIQGRKIKKEVFDKEKHKGFKITASERLLYRSRYFTDSGIIGSKAFVRANYIQFKHFFQAKNEKKPKRVSGFSGMHSLKRLSP